MFLIYLFGCREDGQSGRTGSGQEEHLLVKWKKTISSAQFWMQTGCTLGMLVFAVQLYWFSVLVLDFECVPYSWYIHTWPINNV